VRSKEKGKSASTAKEKGESVEAAPKAANRKRKEKCGAVLAPTEY
jgi:hypothetical protein